MSDNSENTTPVTAEEKFTLEEFESIVHDIRNDERSVRTLIYLLSELDGNYGDWGRFQGFAPGQTSLSMERHVCTRIAGAVTTLFSRPGFSISAEGFRRLMNYHRWLAMIFSISSYGHGDHIIRNINGAGGGIISPISLNENNLPLFCLSYYPDSQIELQMDALWGVNRPMMAALFFAMLSGRTAPTPAAHKKKEQLLAWFPDKLMELGTLDNVPTGVLHDVYMHCSYADLSQKHKIKRVINHLLRKQLLSEGKRDITLPPPSREKPVVLVITEWFTSQHSVWRTHSESLRALKSKYTLVGAMLDTSVDSTTAALFDTCHRFQGDIVGQIYSLAHEIRPDIVYYLGVGMFTYTIYLSNLRLAPLQIVGLGHGASTFATCLDYFLVDSDFIGDEGCFSERVEPLPVGAQPFVPPANTSRILPDRISYHNREPGTPVRVAVCASVMKINPGFLSVLAEITKQARSPVQFCFYLGFAHGLTFHYLRATICTFLPNAEVNAHMGIQDYQLALNSCDLFVNPFPYGNMNSVVDVVRQCLPGVCLSGAEIHTHIDEGLFRRLKLPSEWIAMNTDDYVTAAVALIDDHKQREIWQAKLCEDNIEGTLFEGHPELFVQAVTRLHTQSRSMAKTVTDVVETG